MMDFTSPHAVYKALRDARAENQRLRGAIQAFLTAYGSQDSSTAGLDRAAELCRGAIDAPQPWHSV